MRNQYQSTGYTDTGLQNDLTYYYGVFAFNEDGVASDGAFVSATPKTYDPILSNNSWETIEDIGAQGLAPSIWEIGDEKDFTVNSKTLTAVIIGFNRTSLVSGGTAPITFGTKNLMASKKVVKYGWWNETAMGKYVINTLPTQMEEDLQAVLKTVTAYCGYKSYASYTNPDDYVTESRAYQTKAFGFTSKEVFGSKGPGYAQYPYFATQSNRVKKLNNGAGAASEWALTESVYQRLQVGGNTTLYYYCFIVTRDGVERRDFNTDESSGTSLGVCFGFCV